MVLQGLVQVAHPAVQVLVKVTKVIFKEAGVLLVYGLQALLQRMKEIHLAAAVRASLCIYYYVEKNVRNTPKSMYKPIKVQSYAYVCVCDACLHACMSLSLSFGM